MPDQRTIPDHITPAQRAKILRLHRAGHTRVSIARDYAIAPHAVTLIIKHEETNGYFNVHERENWII